MKKIFYIYWIWYLILMILNNIGLVLPLWTANLYKAAMHANFAYLAFFTLLEFLDEKKISRVNHIYLEAIIVSFGFRSLLYIFSAWNLSNRWDILAVFGVVQLGYYIFDVRTKIKRIEKTLL